MKFVGDGATGSFGLVDVVTNRAEAFEVQTYTTTSGVLTVLTAENFSMVLTSVGYLYKLDLTTKVIIQQIY